MAQEYNEILPSGSTNILQDNIDSRKNDEALRSGFSGSEFPTSPVPVAGQRCYREDLKKEYIFNGEGWVEVASSGAIAQEVALARGTHAELQDRLSVSMNPDGTLKTPATANVDEFKISGFEPTYVSTNSFSVPGDVRAIFTENRRLKITQGAETVYPAVVSSSYDNEADKTTIVIDGITITTEITAVDFSMVQSGLPANLQDVAEKDQPGGYAGLDNNGAINSKIRSTYISDFNTATIGGLYYAGTGTLNGPPLYANTVLVIDRLTNERLTQIVFGNSAEVYIRYSTNKANTEWTDWRILDGAVPTGAVAYFSKNTPPDGWLKCNGAEISREIYSKLFAVIGTVYGAGDGSTTFKIPDLRGEFIRGWDNGAGIDSGRAFASNQLDAFQGHWHEARSQKIATGTANDVGRENGSAIVNNMVNNPISDGTNGTPRTASETRPRNVALLACIKY